MGDALRQRVNRCILRLSDRDTEAMAAADLDAIARSLPSDAIATFVAAIADVRSADKPAVRRHSVRLLTLLASSHPVEVLSPHVSRLVAALLRRLRDGDSSVRSSCAAAAASIASVSDKSGLFTLLKQLADAVFREQDRNSQYNAALCLSAAMSAANGSEVDVMAFLQRILPKLVKLLRSNAFKAKPALVQLLGAAAAAGGAGTPAIAVGLLIPCLRETLASEDWAARKAAAEALAALAAREGKLLGSCKRPYIAAFEARRYDKVKIVRDSMNRMIEAWKAIPDCDGERVPLLQSGDDLSEDQPVPGPANGNSARSAKNKLSYESPAMANTKVSSSPGGRSRRVPMAMSTGKNVAKNADWKVAVSTPEKSVIEETLNVSDQTKGGGERFRKEGRRMLFQDCADENSNKLTALKSRVVPEEEDAKLELTGKERTESATEELRAFHRDGDLSAIKLQLLQIENQQSSLLDLMQKFIGSSQNGLSSLERRVHGLEMTLDEISRDLAASSGRGSTDPGAGSCCRLPGAEFLSPKFWRRHDSRYSSRFIVSDMQQSDNSRGSFRCNRPRVGSKGSFVINPLAETDHLISNAALS